MEGGYPYNPGHDLNMEILNDLHRGAQHRADEIYSVVSNEGYFLSSKKIIPSETFLTSTPKEGGYFADLPPEMISEIVDKLIVPRKFRTEEDFVASLINITRFAQLNKKMRTLFSDADSDFVKGIAQKTKARVYNSAIITKAADSLKRSHIFWTKYDCSGRHDDVKILPFLQKLIVEWDHKNASK